MKVATTWNPVILRAGRGLSTSDAVEVVYVSCRPPCLVAKHFHLPRCTSPGFWSVAELWDCKTVKDTYVVRWSEIIQVWVDLYVCLVGVFLIIYKEKIIQPDFKCGIKWVCTLSCLWRLLSWRCLHTPTREEDALWWCYSLLLGFVEAEPTFGLINHGLVPTSGGSGKSPCPVGALQIWDLCGSGGNPPPAGHHQQLHCKYNINEYMSCAVTCGEDTAALAEDKRDNKFFPFTT